jgi:hypothetical protein
MKKELLIAIIFIILSSSVIASNITYSVTQYRAIADEVSQFSASLQNTFESEQKLRQRGFFKKIFIGADWPEARNLQNLTEKNLGTLKTIKSRIESCESCADEETELLEGQIAEMKKEQEKLRRYAIIQSKLRGLFGWFKR